MRTGIHEEHFAGNCLGALGIPDHGTVTIDFDATPRVFDIVFCDSPEGSIHGFMKQLLRTGDHPLVGTCYEKPERNFLFTPACIMGVALEFRDVNGKVVWKRPEPTKGDKIRAMKNEELADELRHFVCPTRFGGQARCGDTGGCRACWLAFLNEEDSV